MTVRTALVVVFAFVVGFSKIEGQILKGEGCCYNAPRTEVSIKNLTAKAEAIFVGTVSAVEPPNFKVANDKSDELFYATNWVTFAVSSVLKGPEMSSIKIKGSDLLGLYDGDSQFLVFLHKEDKDGFRFYPPNDAFPVGINVESPRYHWEIGVRGGKHLSAEYEPYALRFDMNSSLWMAGDMARWSPSLRKDVEKELIAFDPQFADKKKADEAFSLTTRGCHWYKDEWPAPYIGLMPCPMPLALVKAYIKVLVKEEAKK